MKYIIIGGVAGGATAAARLRRVDEKSDILLFEKGKYISYANCGLPYYIGGVIAEREKLLVQTPTSFGQRFRVDVRVENEVIAIHPKDKTITVRTADGREYEETYDKLLLSPGATPVRPPLEGIDSEGIFTLRNVEDTDHIKSYLTENSVKRAVVVGAGFIGLEMAENLHHAGVAVSVVEMGNQVMAPIDFSMAAPVHQHLIQKGVSLYLEEGVTHFQRTEQGITVFLKSGKTIPADMVLLSIGVRPATALAKQAGLKIGEAGGIWVNEYLETSAKDPIAIAGYVASNIISGAMPVVTWRELVQHKNEVMLIDTRTAEEFSFGTIPGAINIPLDDLRERMLEVPTDKPIVLFCAVGLRGYLAQRILMGNGYKNVRNLSGGYKLYSAAVAPVPVPSIAAASVDARVTFGSTETSGTVVQSDSILSAGGSSKEPLKINACGLQCPGPIMQVKKAMDTLEPGEQVEIVATDAGFARDASAWCDTTGNRLVGSHEDKGRYTVVIEKGNSNMVCPSSTGTVVAGRGKTLILFSDDLDKALATFVLANGAAATGQKVTVFFTFWGLNVLKKVQKPKVKKDIFGRMFGMMLPSSSLKLKLSQMNMFGMGSRMMRFLMKRKGVDSLESLRSQALAQGVEFIACQMSMDMMGICREELLDEVTIGGVATYMERADKANVNLFI